MSCSRFCEAMAYSKDLNASRKQIIKELFDHEHLKDKMESDVMKKIISKSLSDVHIEDGTNKAFEDAVDKIHENIINGLLRT